MLITAAFILLQALLLRYPADVFLYANTVSCAVDMDHALRYVSLQQGGPPGQTRIGWDPVSATTIG